MITAGTLERLAERLEQAARTLDRLLRKPHRARRFRQLWEANATAAEFYLLANDLHQAAFGAPLSPIEWSRAWQWRTVLHPDYRQARAEFINAVLGWW